MPDNQDQIITALAKMMNNVDRRYDQISEQISSSRNDTMTKMDAVYKEVISMIQEQSAHQAQHTDITDRLDAIEAVPVVAHDLKLKN